MNTLNKTKQLKRCKDCGMPIIVGEYLKWRSSGTIGPAKRSTDIFLACDEYNYLFSAIEKRMGLSIKKIIQECSRISALDYALEMISGFRKILVRNRFISKIVLRKYTLENMKLLGLGAAEFKEYIYKKSLSLALKNVLIHFL